MSEGRTFRPGLPGAGRDGEPAHHVLTEPQPRGRTTDQARAHRLFWSTMFLGSGLAALLLISLMLFYKAVQERRGGAVGWWQVRVAVALGISTFVFLCLFVLFEPE